MAINKKTKALFQLMEHFLTHKEISSHDPFLLEKFGCSQKTLERHLKEIEELYGHIVTLKRGHKKVWRLVGVSDIFAEFIKNSDDISQLFLMAREFDAEIFRDMEKELSSIAKDDESIFMFKNSIMEDIQNPHQKEIFKKLKVAIKNHEYRDIYYKDTQKSLDRNLKCLKMLFMDNNWYVVVVNEQGKLLFKRLSFIEEVRYAQKSSFKLGEIEKHLEFLSTVQNAMTLYDEKPKIATIKATPKVAHYFDKGMKRFLSSQTFVKKESDGSVIFTLSYTQPLEVLPLVQKWLPDLIIVEPKELQEVYVKKLQESLGYYL